MRLFNGTPDEVICKVPGRKPGIFGREEMRWPCRAVRLPVGQFTDLPDAEGMIVLERFGVAGVIPVTPNTPLEEATLDAKSVRLDFLRGRLIEYREQQAERQAMGHSILLPRKHHRRWLKELEALTLELQGQEVLTKDLGIVPTVKPSEDAIARELRSFGIEPEAAMLPRSRGPEGLETIINL